MYGPEVVRGQSWRVSKWAKMAKKCGLPNEWIKWPEKKMVIQIFVGSDVSRPTESIKKGSTCARCKEHSRIQ